MIRYGTNTVGHKMATVSGVCCDVPKVLVSNSDETILISPDTRLKVLLPQKAFKFGLAVQHVRVKDSA